MNKSSIYDRTEKGWDETRAGGKSLPQAASKLLMMIDGKSSVADLLGAFGNLPEAGLLAMMKALEEQGFIRMAGTAPASAGAGKKSGQAVHEAGDAPGALPVLDVTELSPQESVRAWAEAQRGAKALEKNGFHTYDHRRAQPVQTAPGQSLNVLVVEDDEALARTMEMLLVNKGFVVQKSADTQSALAALQGDTVPDLVLLDIVLPGPPDADGFHVLEHIRRSNRLSEIPVIMVTSQISDEHVMRGLKAGADGYIFKPFKWEALYESISSVISA